MRRAGRGRRSAGTLGLYALVGLGVIATILAVVDTRRTARQADERAANLAAAQIGAGIEQAMSGVRGADGLAIDGRVDPEEFDAFARGVVDQSVFAALAYSQVVTAAERDRFVASTGITLRDTDGAGGFVPSPPRDVSYVVVDTYPETDATRAVLGFDLASDETRRQAAERATGSSTPVLSDRISTATGARPGVSIVSAVQTPDGRTIGFVTSGLSFDDIVTKTGVDLESLAGFGFYMDGELMSGADANGARRELEISGHSFAVVADDGQQTNLLMPLLIGLGTLALAVVVAAATRRERDQRRQLDLAARRSSGIAALGQRLTGSADATALAEEAVRHAGPVVGARWTIVTDDGATTAGAGVVASEPTDPGVRSFLTTGPVADCIRSAEPVVIERLEAAEGASGPGAPPTAVRAAIAVPLVFSNGTCHGALAFAWDAPMSREEAEARTVAATTMAELTSKGLERALLNQSVRDDAEALSSFTQALARSQSPGDVVAAVEARVPDLLGATSAALLLGSSRVTPAPDPVRRPVVHTVVNDEGTVIGRLDILLEGGRDLDSTRRATLDTLAGLIGQTLSRTVRAEQEHRVIVELQRVLLPVPPVVVGLETEVWYQPAMSVVGLGGDFYDVVVSDAGKVFLVIGDITGHGSEAVAAMAELKSMLHHQLRSGATLTSVCDQADQLLVRREVLASAQLLEIDRAEGMLRYVNAGHPYPIQRRADGTTRQLRDGHRPLLGVPGRASGHLLEGEATFGADDVLVLYTDGLIERRTHSIDTVMDDLQRVIGTEGHRPPAELITALQASRSHEDNVDDDVAVIVARAVAIEPGSAAAVSVSGASLADGGTTGEGEAEAEDEGEGELARLGPPPGAG